MACLAGWLAGFGVVGCRRGGLPGAGGVVPGVWGPGLGRVGARRGWGLGRGSRCRVGAGGSAGVGDGEEGSGAGVLFGQAQQDLSGGVAHEGGEVP